MTDFNNINEEKLSEQVDPADAIVNKVEKVVEAAEAKKASAEEIAPKAEPDFGSASAPQPSYTAPQQPQYNQPYGGNRQTNYSSQYNSGPQQQQPSQNQYRPPNNGAPYNNQQPQYSPYVPRPVPQGYVQKNRILAGLLGIIFGGIGLHNFYLGFTTRAVIQIVVSVVTCGIGSLWGLIEGIMIIAGSYNNNCDANGIQTKEM